MSAARSPTSATAAAGAGLPYPLSPPSSRRASALPGPPSHTRPVGGVGAVGQGPGMWEMRQGGEGVREWGSVCRWSFYAGQAPGHQEWRRAGLPARSARCPRAPTRHRGAEVVQEAAGLLQTSGPSAQRAPPAEACWQLGGEAPGQSQLPGVRTHVCLCGAGWCMDMGVTGVQAFHSGRSTYACPWHRPAGNPGCFLIFFKALKCYSKPHLAGWTLDLSHYWAPLFCPK